MVRITVAGMLQRVKPALDTNGIGPLGTQPPNKTAGARADVNYSSAFQLDIVTQDIGRLLIVGHRMSIGQSIQWW